MIKSQNLRNLFWDSFKRSVDYHIRHLARDSTTGILNTWKIKL